MDVFGIATFVSVVCHYLKLAVPGGLPSSNGTVNGIGEPAMSCGGWGGAS
jgi:hypothetical protein